MELVLVRHAAAFERDSHRWPDDALRPLTPAGRHKFRDVAKGIRKLLPCVDVLLTSSLIRATETGQILHECARWPAAQVCDALVPGRPTAAVFAALRKVLEGDGIPGNDTLGDEPHRRVALVGHEPQISRLLSASIAGASEDVWCDFRKGALAVIEFERAAAPGCGRLLWFATPSLIRTLRRKRVRR